MKLKYIPARFGRVLEEIGKTQVELANDLGMAQPSISNILSGKTKDVSIKIRDYLRNKHKVNPDYLYGLTGEIFLTEDREALIKKIEFLNRKIERQDYIIELQYKEIKELKKTLLAVKEK